jgi:hypothetical protein
MLEIKRERMLGKSEMLWQTTTKTKGLARRVDLF